MKLDLAAIKNRDEIARTYRTINTLLDRGADVPSLIQALEELEADLQTVKHERDTLMHALTDEVPLTTPLMRDPRLRAWQQVTSMFNRRGMQFSTTHFRDEIVTAFQWAWFGYNAMQKADALSNQSSEPGEHQEVLDAIEACNTGEDQ